MILLDWDDLRARGIKLSRSQIWRKVRNGTFPAPVYFGQSPAWPENEIDLYIEKLIAERDRRAEAPNASAA